MSRTFTCLLLLLACSCASIDPITEEEMATHPEQNKLWRSLGGDRFFYVNPLEADGQTKFNQHAAGRAP